MSWVSKQSCRALFVEVTTKKGIQYGIWAYGEDTIDLYRETLNILSIHKLVIPY